jgi:alpha-tubulin suppressor-like RCC1 family protein
MATTIFHAVNVFPGDGVKTTWDFQFDGVIPDTRSGTAPYLYPKDVKAQEVYNDENGVQIVIQRDVELLAPATIKVLGTPIPLGRNVRIYRDTEVRYPLVDYRDRQVVTEDDLDLSSRQTLFAVMEVTDRSIEAIELAREANVSAGKSSEDSTEALRVAAAAEQKADSAVLASGRAEQVAGQADQKAVQALDAAQAAEDHATNVETLAAAAEQKAQDAVDASAAATQTANQAKATAEGIEAKADTAIATADRAEQKADTAINTANGIDGKADTAIQIANEAKQIATTADGKADQAINTANGIASTADQALLVAGNAKQTADDAAASVLTFDQRILDNKADIAKLQNKKVWLSPIGYSSSTILVGGNLYCSIATNTGYPNLASGLGKNPVFTGASNYFRVPIPSTSPVIKYAQMGFVCFALLENGSLYTWGSSNYGQTGLGHTLAVLSPTLSTMGVQDFYSAPSSCGWPADAGSILVRKADGIYTCGNNARNQLVDGTTANRSVWVKTWDFATRGGVTKMFLFGNYQTQTFIVTADNRLWTGGSNLTGCSGVGHVNTMPAWVDVTDRWGGVTDIAKLVDVQGGSQWLGPAPEATVGQEAVTVMVFTDHIKTCGSNVFGQIGGGGVGGPTQLVPYRVPLTFAPKQVQVMGGGPCGIYALSPTGEVWAWGYNATANLGIPGNVSTGTPTKLAFPTPVKSILSRGYDRSRGGYAYTAFFAMEPVDGVYRLFSLGQNQWGECGIGDVSGQRLPGQVVLPARNPDGSALEVVQIGYNLNSYADSGANTIIALTNAGHIYAWGHNGYQGVHGFGSTEVAAPISMPNSWLKELL